MTTVQIRKALVHYLEEEADEQFLKMVYAMMKIDMDKIQSLGIDFTAAERKMILQRRDELLSGKVKGIPAEKSLQRIRTKLRAKKK